MQLYGWTALSTHWNIKLEHERRRNTLEKAGLTFDVPAQVNNSNSSLISRWRWDCDPKHRLQGGLVTWTEHCEVRARTFSCILQSVQDQRETGEFLFRATPSALVSSGGSIFFQLWFFSNWRDITVIERHTFRDDGVGDEATLKDSRHFGDSLSGIKRYHSRISLPNVP